MWARVLVLAVAIAGCGENDDGGGGNAGSAGAGGAGGSGGGGSGGTGGSAGAGGAGGTGGAGGAGGAAGSAGQPPELEHYVYVANREGDSIDIFRRDDAGALTDLGEVTLNGPAPLAVSPDRTRLFAGLTASSEIAVYDIDFASGGLSPAGTTNVGIRPVSISVDGSGQHLFVASYSDDTVQVHAIGSDGSVGSAPESSHSPGTNPHFIQADPSNAWVFVPVTNSDLVAQYAFDASSGTLTPNQPPNVATGSNVGPRHLVFHPTLSRVYVVNEHADSVTAYAFDAATGQLSSIDTESTLPSGVNGTNNTCADIHVTPDGKYVYASNRGHDSLAGFAVDATSGELTPIGHTPTEPTPREFEITPDGRFVYAAGQDSDQVAAYAVEADGALTPLATYPVGAGPLWVLAISVPSP
jgi:6-phosphogluconolactonase